MEEGQAVMEGNRNVGKADRHRASSESHLHLALDLEAEGFIPLWVWAVGDGPSPQPLTRSSGQPEAHKAVCLAHCPRKTRVGGKGGEPTQVQRGEYRVRRKLQASYFQHKPSSPLLTHG